MNVFTLPTGSYNLQNKIHFYSMSSNTAVYICNQSLVSKINSLKEQIDSVNEEWDIIKKNTNPYEYIHTSIPYTKLSIAKYKPISRAYFKLIEIMNTFKLSWNHPIQSFHLAEGPGGFIEALLRYRKNPLDRYTGMTLKSDNYQTPGWKKAKRFLSKWREQIQIESGHDETGNLFVYQNYRKLKTDCSGTYDFVTGDGGFDFSVCYNMQECLSSRLIFAQIVYALMLLKENGVFVLKVFDCYTRSSIDMLWTLSCVFQEVDVIKPNTSRFANSEKYIVCRGYNKNSGLSILENLEFILEKLETPPPGMNIQQILENEPPLYFMNKMIEINAVLGQQQMEMIQNTLSIIRMDETERKERIRVIQYGNLQKCIYWCKTHNEPYNTLQQTYAEALSNSKYRSPSLR